ncbi:MAG: transposase [Myxococcales bacterium]|nr:transposase [Myxococcales bacterium]
MDYLLMKMSEASSCRRGRTAKRLDQLLLFPPRAKRGGKRRGAGRKPKGLRAGAKHKPRRELSGREPVHVTLRVVSAVGNLRRREAYRAIREATVTTARREGFRIVQLSIQRTHLHLLVEADHKSALASGMQGFQISAAKHLNAAVGKEQGGRRRRGTVFPDRYFAVAITSPRQARNTLAYIMCNWRRHGEHVEPAYQSWLIDWFSSASTFPGWHEYGDNAFLWQRPEQYDPLVVYQPRTWLLREGWKRHGLISCHEVPSTKA